MRLMTVATILLLLTCLLVGATIAMANVVATEKSVSPGTGAAEMGLGR